MGKLKEYLAQPKVEIRGKKFVDERLFIELLEEMFENLKKDTVNQDKKEGIDLCISLILNWLLRI